MEMEDGLIGVADGGSDLSAVPMGGASAGDELGLLTGGQHSGIEPAAGDDRATELAEAKRKWAQGEEDKRKVGAAAADLAMGGPILVDDPPRQQQQQLQAQPPPLPPPLPPPAEPSLHGILDLAARPPELRKRTKKDSWSRYFRLACSATCPTQYSVRAADEAWASLGPDAASQFQRTVERWESTPVAPPEPLVAQEAVADVAMIEARLDDAVPQLLELAAKADVEELDGGGGAAAPPRAAAVQDAMLPEGFRAGQRDIDTQRFSRMMCVA